MPEKLPSMPFFVSDYLSNTDVLLMSLAERGLYTHLLFRQWQDGRLEFDTRNLSILCACSEPEFIEQWEGIKHKFVTDSDGRIYNRRAEVVKGEYASLREARSAAGSKGGSKTQAKLKQNAKQNAKQTSSKNQPPVQSSPVQSFPFLSKPVPRLDGEPLEVVALEAPTSKPSAGPLQKNPAKARRPALTKSAETWTAYSAAYHNRYGVDPTRNQTVNGQMAQFITRVPLAEAPSIAAFYVGHNDNFYIRKSHSVGLLLADSEKLRTEWQNGRKVTGKRALQDEGTATNFDNAEEAKRILRRMDDDDQKRKDSGHAGTHR